MKTIYKIALFIVLAIAIVGIGTAIYFFNMQHRDLGKVKPDFTITAVDLQKAFEDNEAAANTRYVNKVLEVSGVIASLKPGENNSLSVFLKTGSDLSSVICTFQQGTALSGFKPGDAITIRGSCSGYLTDVLLNDCALMGK
ncbi:MAG: hypothetical protein WCE64_15580 [Bacteroidales bacterium]